MPLAFPSTSHELVAFGFFNIELDLLLLDRLFFFAEDFCDQAVALADRSESLVGGWRIGDRNKIGNLHGAIQGVDLSGFIGAAYQSFPFPARPEGFKQNPEGSANRAWAQELIGRFGQDHPIRLRWQKEERSVSIDEYRFAENVFADLIAYVDRGGHPGWKEGRRPAYVRRMLESLGKLPSPFT